MDGGVRGQRHRRRAARRVPSTPARSCRPPSTARPTSTSCTPSRTTSDGGLLYYRKDLLEEAGVEVPKTWTELKAACDKIKAKAGNEKLDCYAGQHDKYEGGTVNFAETVNSAGGVIIGDDGKPNVNTPEAKKGLDRLQAWFKDGTIPEGAITWKEENGRPGVPGRHADLPSQLAGYVYARATRRRTPPRSRASSTSPRCRARTVRASPAWAATTWPSPSTARTRALRSSSPSGGPAPRSRRERAGQLLDPRGRNALRRSRARGQVPLLAQAARVDRDSRAPTQGASSTVTSPWPSRMPCTPSSRAAILKAALTQLQTKLEGLDQVAVDPNRMQRFRRGHRSRRNRCRGGGNQQWQLPLLSVSLPRSRGTGTSTRRML